ncbi:MAG: hypothetical protein AAF633_00380 [Chloroflexota bacterium]
MKNKALRRDKKKKIRRKRNRDQEINSVAPAGRAAAQLKADQALLQARYGNVELNRLLDPAAARAEGNIDQDIASVAQRPLVPAVQRKGGGRKPLPADKGAREKEIKEKIKAGQRRRKAEKEADNGWFGKNTMLGKAAGMMGFSKGEEEKKEDGFSVKRPNETDYEGSKVDGESEAEDEEKKYGAYADEKLEKEIEQEEKESKEDEAKAFDIKKITINLVDLEGHKEGALGELDVKGGLKRNVEGYQGEAEIEWQFGQGGKLVRDKFPWDIENKVLTPKTSTEIEGFLGAKAGGKASGEWTEQSVGAKGKASAFAGGELSGKTEIEFKSNGKNVGKASGTLGATWGIGGEFEFNVKWGEGKIRVGGKTKMSAGLGFSAGYELELNTKGIVMNWLKGWFGY